MSVLNSREQALLIWLAVLAISVLAAPKLRPSTLAVIRAFFQWKIVTVVVSSGIYAAGCVWLLMQIDAWSAKNFKTTIVWWLTFAFVALMDTRGLEEAPRTLRKIARDALAVSTVTVFFAEFYTFPLWGELLLLPALAILTGLITIAQYRPEHSILVEPLTAILIVSGIIILGYSTYHIVTNLESFATIQTAREFVVPILLSLMFLPFLYLIGLIMAYENAAIQLKFTIEDPRLRRYAFWRGLFAFGAKADTVRRYVRDLRVAGVNDRAGVGRVVHDLCLSLLREQQRSAVDWNSGWAPHDAREYLADEQLMTGDYHRSFENEWWAQSTALAIGGEPFEDRLTYRVYGTETAVTRLQIELNAYLPGQPHHSDARFFSAALLLIRRALGDETADRFEQVIAGQDTASMKAGTFIVTLARDDWGGSILGGYSRRVTLTHPAHYERYPGLN